MKILYVFLGLIFVLLGFIGLFLPVVPTVPFLVMAAYFFSKSSPRLHAWLFNHPHFGPPLKDWFEHGVIPKRAKIIATIMLSISLVGIWFFTTSKMVIKITATILVAIGVIFIWNQKSEKN